MMFLFFRDNYNLENYIALDLIKMIKWPYIQNNIEYYDILLQDNKHIHLHKNVDEEAFLSLKKYLEENRLK